MKLSYREVKPQIVTLENKLKERGEMLIVESLSGVSGFSIGFSSEDGLKKGISFRNCPLQKTLDEFGKICFLKMPVLGEFSDITPIVRNLLVKGDESEGSKLRFNLIFEYKKGYLSRMNILKDSWEKYVELNGMGSFSSRDLETGKSKNNFTEAYLDMGYGLKGL